MLYLVFLFNDLHCLCRNFNSTWIFSPLWFGKNEHLWCLKTSTSFYCWWITVQHRVFSSCRFEYHAAAEVIKVVEFEEVDGMLNVDITEYRCYELTLGCLFSYLEQANALLLWANKQSCIFSSRYISTCSIMRMMNICSSVIYVIGT